MTQRAFAAADTQRVLRLGRRLRFFQGLCGLLALILAVLLSNKAISWVKAHRLDVGWLLIDKQAPHAQEVGRVLKPLRYSGLQTLMRPEVSLSINPSKQTWTMHHVHRFGPQGDALLEEGRYGICGELSEFTYQQIKPLFDPRHYLIEFVRVFQSEFFPAPISAHYVLRISELAPPDPPKVFILDSSFGRYGPIEAFEDYLFNEPLAHVPFMHNHAPDETFHAGEGMPILLHSRGLEGIFIGRENRRFDAKHYRLSLVATARYHYATRTLLIFRNKGGQVEVVENRHLVPQLLPRQEYEQLRQRLLDLFRGITIEGEASS